MSVLNAPTTSAQLDKQFKDIDAAQKRKPGRPKQAVNVVKGDPTITDATLWREAMMALIVAQDIKHPKQLETISVLADEYVAIFKEKFK